MSLRRPRPVSARPGRPGRRLPTVLAAVLCVLAIVALGACGGGSDAEDEALYEAQIEADLSEYMPLLERAYRERDTEILAPYAAEKERAFLDKRITDLSRQGQVLAPSLETMTIEDVVVWNRVNAYATTVETWTLQVLAAGTDDVVREETGQVNRVTYQLKWDGERWRVLSRQLKTTYE